MLITAVMLSACTYNAAVAPPPPVPIETSLDTPLQGPVGLIIDVSEMERNRRARPGTCPGQTFEVEAGGAFRAATLAAFAQVFAGLAPEDGTAGRRLRVTVEDIGYRGKVEVGMTENTFRATAEITAAAVLEDAEGSQIYAARREASGNAEDGMAITCDNIPDILGQAMGEAIAKVTTDLAERLANSPKVRKAFKEQ